MDGPQPQNNAQPSRMRILVVDDCRDTARMMWLLLRGEGYEVKLASTGQEAIETAGTFQPEIVLVDIALPDMDGCDVASQLRRLESSRDAVIIAVSGYGPDEERRRAHEELFDHHFVKPVNGDALLRLLSTATKGCGPGFQRP
jgi:CheY-like chemotaxis protein